MIVVTLIAKSLQEMFKVVESLRNIQIIDLEDTNLIEQTIISYEDFKRLISHKEIVYAKVAFKDPFKSLKGGIFVNKVLSTQGFKIYFDSVDDYRKQQDILTYLKKRVEYQQIHISSKNHILIFKYKPDHDDYFKGVQFIPRDSVKEYRFASHRFKSITPTYDQFIIKEG